MGDDPRVSDLLEDVERSLEEQELAGRVLRKLIQSTLYEAKLARAEAAAMGERIASLEAAVGRVARGGEEEVLALRARMAELSLHTPDNGETPLAVYTPGSVLP